MRRGPLVLGVLPWRHEAANVAEPVRQIRVTALPSRYYSHLVLVLLALAHLAIATMPPAAPQSRPIGSRAMGPARGLPAHGARPHGHLELGARPVKFVK